MSDMVGKPVQRLDGRLKVTGQARFSSDWPQDKKVLHAIIFGSEIASGKIVDFDLKAAKAVSGVVEILTFKNAPKLKAPGKTKGSGPGEKFLPLQNAEVHYLGQHIGAVIAESLEAASEAASLVKVKYEAKKGQMGLGKLKTGAYVIEEMEGMGPINSRRGDFKKAFKQAEVKIQQAYTTPIENHNPMEPSATLAVYENDKYTIYDASQGVFSMAKVMSDSLDVPITDLHGITKFVGGGFGCKGSVWGHQFIAAMAAKRTGRPVKLSLTRQQMFTGVGHRAPTLQDLALGATKDGKLLAVSHETVNSTATNKDFSERCGSPTKMLYSCANVNVVHKLKKVNTQTPTFMRAPGESSGSFALESAMDELAVQLKMDPVELRVKNHADQDESENKPFSSKSLKACYEQGAAKFNWSRRKPEPRSVKDGDWYVGYGMATATYPARRFPATVQVELLRDGSARVTSATQDIGTGSWTVFAQIAAQYLGLPMERVKFELGDSRMPQASVSGGSTTLSSVGTAVKMACLEARTEIAKLASGDAKSPLHQAAVDTISMDDGRVFLTAQKDRGEPVIQLLTRNGRASLIAKGEAGENDADSKKYSGHSFGAQFVEVRVHSLTGETRVAKATGAFASGKIVNPLMGRSQYMGGMIFGIGMGLMEETRIDERSGRPMVRDLAEYHMPVNADVPELEIIMVDEVDEHINPIGTKGIGEIGIVGMAAAIANAVYNATGVRVRDLPITPEKVMAALKV